MAEVLEIAIEGADELSLNAVADAVAQVLGAEVRRAGSTDAAAAVTELAQPSVLLGVLSGSSGPADVLLQAAPKPLVVVPSAGWLPSRRITRVLAPLDGSPESAAAVAPLVGRLCQAGLIVIVLHVFDAATAPRFADHEAHSEGVWEQEFLARYCHEPGVQMQVRSGSSWEHVLDVATTENVDLIVLGWSQRLGEDRARTVRRTLDSADVPVLLAPVGAPHPVTTEAS